MPVITASQGGFTVQVERARTVSVQRDSVAAAEVADRATVNTVSQSVATVKVGSVGPQGPAGTPGGASELRVASGILSGHRIVRSLDADQVGYASADNPDHGDDTLGMTLGAADAGAAVNVQRTGPVEMSGWAWTPGESVFLGRDGMPTQSPAADDAFVQVIGYAESPTVLYLDFQPPIYF